MERVDRRQFLAYLGLTVASVGAAKWGSEIIVDPSTLSNNPLYRELSELDLKINQLTSELRSSGTIARGGFLNQSWELRKPSDPRLDTWGTLRNQRDEISAQIDALYTQQHNPEISRLQVLSLFLGPITIMLGLGGIVSALTRKVNPSVSPSSGVS